MSAGFTTGSDTGLTKGAIEPEAEVSELCVKANGCDPSWASTGAAGPTAGRGTRSRLTIVAATKATGGASVTRATVGTVEGTTATGGSAANAATGPGVDVDVDVGVAMAATTGRTVATEVGGGTIGATGTDGAGRAVRSSGTAAIDSAAGRAAGAT